MATKAKMTLKRAAAIACRAWRREPAFLSAKLNDAMFRLEELAKTRRPKSKKRDSHAPR
jgi:hypothetical protein